MVTSLGGAHSRCLHMSVDGAVQGVGFRPFVYRLATDLRLAGWVQNSERGVTLEVEGEPSALQRFLHRFTIEHPPQAQVRHIESIWLAARGHTAFAIRSSHASGAKTAVVMPDIATCMDCRRELFDPRDRRYRYPFINCTHCGPRFSIIEAIPYDRRNTTMRHFSMCRPCRAEYDDPQNRRFHAQPNACPQCGPSLLLWDRDGSCLSARHDALLGAADAIRRGAIVAVKGLGGFHLMVDARNETSVQRLRQCKHRPAKPFALMYPSLSMVQRHCHVSTLEEHLLCAAEAPIVLLRRKAPKPPAIVAPGNPDLGIMLPYTPLHHLLLQSLGFPVVATSGNRADEPLCTDEYEALDRLSGIADLFLLHNRPIARHVDDSIVRVLLGRQQVLRRARGYAPLPIRWRGGLDTSTATCPAVVAVGAHSKNAIAATVGGDIVVSQHIGDLETLQAHTAFQNTLNDVTTLYDMRPAALVCDAHPDYRSTREAVNEAVKRGLALRRVQHHYAHVLACMADNELDAPVLGVAWDGSGYGLDGTIWGGEFLLISATSFQRVAHFRPFPLPGGERAVKQPRRTALGLLYALLGEDLPSRLDLAPVRAFSTNERRIVHRMLANNLNAPLTSSVGRLFDAVASILGLRQCATFEGQAAMALEFALDGIETDEVYPFRIDTEQSTAIIDWAPLIDTLLADQRAGVGIGRIAARFHNTLIETVVAMAERQAEKRIVLTGGCFHNRYLTERAVNRLRAEGFDPFWHHRVPPNDGGIAVGQIVAGRRSQLEV